MVVIIILVIVVIAVILGIFYFYQKNNKAIDQITADLDQLNQIKLDDTIKQVSNLKLSGGSLANFSRNSEIYQHIKHDLAPAMQTALITASEKNSSFKILPAKNELSQVKQQAAANLEQLKEVTSQLDTLFTSIQKNQIQFRELQQMVSQQQQVLVDSKEEFGAVATSLQISLNNIKENFGHIIDLINNGDALEAKEKLIQAQEKLQQYQHQVQDVKVRLEVDFQLQIKELQAADNKMKAADIHFSNPQVQTELSQINNLLKQLQDNLVTLDLAKFDETQKQIEDKIDNLYDRIAIEWRDKKKVQKNQLILSDFLNHAKHQNRLLQRTIERLSLKFVLKESDKQKVNLFDHKLDQLSEQYQQQLKKIRNNMAIYSEIWHNFQQINHQLQEIEKEQLATDTELQGLVHAQQVATSNYHDFLFELDQIKHQVEAQRLNGLPQVYLKGYQAVEDQIKRIGATLADLPIDTEELTKQLFVTKEDLSNLAHLAEQLMYDVQLTVRLLQYANRYVSENKNIQLAVDQTQRLFDQDFDYSQARQTISHALEKVESGSVKRIQDLFAEEQNDPV